MTQVQDLLNEAKEKRLDVEALETARAEVESLLFRSRWRNILGAIGVGTVVLVAVFEVRSALPKLALIVPPGVLGFIADYAAMNRRKIAALRRLIEQEAPELHAKLTNRLAD